MAITVTGGPAYGVSWATAASPVLTRVGASSAWEAGAKGGAHIARFSAVAPWSGMRRCNLWDTGTPTAYYGDRCYTDTDVANMGQVMVSVPKFYYYMEYNAATTTYYWFVTPTAATTIDVGLGVGAQPVKIHPAFTRDGVTKDTIYIGAFEGYLNGTTNKLESKAGVQPTTTQTITTFRTAAQLRAGVANKWEQQDYLTVSALQLLYTVEYANLNSQSMISAGITNITDDATHNMASNTGHTTALGNASGEVLHTFDHVPGAGDLSGYAMSYRGVENMWGNVGTYMEGLKIKANANPWIANHDFNDSGTFAHPYVDTSLALYSAGASNTIGNIATNATYDYGFLGASAAGGGTTYFCDLTYYSAGGPFAALNSGSWTNTTGAGIFYLYPAYDAATTYRKYGTRLMYMG